MPHISVLSLHRPIDFLLVCHFQRLWKARSSTRGLYLGMVGADPRGRHSTQAAARTHAEERRLSHTHWDRGIRIRVA